MSGRFRKENQGFTGFSREILESPFTVDVQNSGAAFMPFGTKQLRFTISIASSFLLLKCSTIKPSPVCIDKLYASQEPISENYYPHWSRAAFLDARNIQWAGAFKYLFYAPSPPTLARQFYWFDALY